MKINKNHRCFDRVNHSASLVCSPINTNINYITRKCNHGGGGLCFESKDAFREGMVLNIRMTDYSTNGVLPGEWEGFRTMATGEVKWCREIKDKEGIFYDVGVKYYDPAY